MRNRSLVSAKCFLIGSHLQCKTMFIYKIYPKIAISNPKTRRFGQIKITFSVRCRPSFLCTGEHPKKSMELIDFFFFSSGTRTAEDSVNFGTTRVKVSLNSLKFQFLTNETQNVHYTMNLIERVRYTEHLLRVAFI